MTACCEGREGWGERRANETAPAAGAPGDEVRQESEAAAYAQGRTHWNEALQAGAIEEEQWNCGGKRSACHTINRVVEMTASKTLLQAIAVTAELTGTVLSVAAARVFAEDLARYPERQVLAALARCERTVEGRLTLRDVIETLEESVAWCTWFLNNMELMLSDAKMPRLDRWRLRVQLERIFGGR